MEVIRLRSLSRSREQREEERGEDSSLIGKGCSNPSALEIGVAETDSTSSTSIKSLVLSAIAGNALEWYDFGVFASFSTELSQAFFTGGRLEETLKVYGVFAVAFVARPVGGLLFGLIGDRYGRTVSLQISVILMGISVFLMAIIPTNSLGRYSIGSTATMLVVVVRLIQGLSVGGEMVGSYIFMAENVPGNWKCVVSTVPSASATLGVATGYLCSGIISATLSDEARLLWGWRLGFALGVPAGLVGFMFRSTFLSESEAFTSATQKFSTRHQGQHPFFYALKHEPAAILTQCVLSLFVCTFFAASGWYMGIWLETFYTQLIDQDVRISETRGRFLNTLLLFFGSSLGAMTVAYLIDKGPQWIPYQNYILASAAALAICSPVFLWLMSFGTSCYWCVFLGHLAQIMTLLPTVSTFALFISSQFPVQVQYASIGLTYNLAQAIFGGTVPYVATKLAVGSKSLLAPAFYISSLAIVGVIGILLGQLPSVKTMKGDLACTMNS